MALLTREDEMIRNSFGTNSLILGVFILLILWKLIEIVFPATAEFPTSQSRK